MLLYLFVVFEPGGLLSFEDVVIFADLVDVLLEGDDLSAFLALLHIHDLL